MIPVKVTLSSTTDLGPALAAFAQQARRVAGEPGVTELQPALAAVEKTLSADLPAQAREAAIALKATLPAGVRLLSLEQEHEGLQVTSRTTLHFEDVSVLPRVPMFVGFAVHADGDVVRVEGAAPHGRVKLELETETKVVQHNAARVDGARLTWEGSGFELKVALPLRS